MDKAKEMLEEFEDMAKLVENLHHLHLKDFYGSFEIIFEKGKVVHCKKTESIKL